MSYTTSFLWGCAVLCLTIRIIRIDRNLQTIVDWIETHESQLLPSKDLSKNTETKHGR